MRVAGFIAGRFAGMLLVLLIVTFVTFLVFYILPSDPAQLACGRPCSPQSLELAREFMGFNSPWYQQFFDFVGGIFTGRTFGSGPSAIHCPAPCFGYDFQNNAEVLTEILDRVEVSFSVAIGAAIIWLITGVGLGVVSALKRGTTVDRVTMAVAMAGVSMPAYLAGMIGITIFAFALDVVPKTGYVPIGEDPVQWAWHLVLPWLVLAFLHAAIYARLTRGQMLETLGEDFIRTARAKGLTERKVIGRHALRNVLLPIVTVFGVDLGALLAGTVITERIFGLPGVGKLLVDGIAGLNLPILLGVTLFSALLVTFVNFLVDLLYGVLDPRARLT
ncbi:peptide/nickel transport system permease protein [Kibdelosporangium banguiense]|uniref:Peptide/nickel transport system permease protein n=1 Tax=Kibdelosporangium banguiense TaxID=1365924 RepID=A0ABS4TF23_9PSEU|nr:ABC transporter permease [Kibdelosporangium banguiense]MBP2323017.1 peptide/nickel transport system permease protein [Kibdelosporangium banguiense]